MDPNNPSQNPSPFMVNTSPRATASFQDTLTSLLSPTTTVASQPIITSNHLLSPANSRARSISSASSSHPSNTSSSLPPALIQQLLPTEIILPSQSKPAVNPLEYYHFHHMYEHFEPYIHGHPVVPSQPPVDPGHLNPHTGLYSQHPESRPRRHSSSSLLRHAMMLLQDPSHKQPVSALINLFPEHHKKPPSAVESTCTIPFDFNHTSFKDQSSFQTELDTIAQQPASPFMLSHQTPNFTIQIPSAPSSGPSTPRPSSTQKGKKKNSISTDGTVKKRKKVARACNHCKKAHVTCEEARPCSRCIKKGLADTCVDGPRKIAKYLQEDDLISIVSASPSKDIKMESLSSMDQALDTLLTPTASATQTSPILLHPPALTPTLSQSAPMTNFASSMMGLSPPPIDQKTPSPVVVPQEVSSMADARRVNVYSAVTKPYDYKEGFHYLLNYIKQRMVKDDVMRVCKAIAQFRPSFMAQIMDLSEEDLIFMEKSFQRVILEFEKIISLSGTPTVVWRRTGEIALIGKEFTFLTQWTFEQLFSRKTYIYELMDHASTVNYWEKFSLIAFDNSQQSIQTSCTLITPTGQKIECAFCFTIKRDIFDVPMAIVGNFLPKFVSSN